MLVGVVVQILAGGLVAGLNAGLVYNTFPLMGGGIVPDDLMAMAPGWLNLIENPTTVQFDHRLIAYLLVAGTAVLYWQAGRAVLSAEARRALYGLVAALVVQIALGILALVYLVPVALGVLHQAGALVVFTANLYLVHRLSMRRLMRQEGDVRPRAPISSMSPPPTRRKRKESPVPWWRNAWRPAPTCLRACARSTAGREALSKTKRRC